MSQDPRDRPGAIIRIEEPRRSTPSQKVEAGNAYWLSKAVEELRAVNGNLQRIAQALERRPSDVPSRGENVTHRRVPDCEHGQAPWHCSICSEP